MLVEEVRRSLPGKVQGFYHIHVVGGDEIMVVGIIDYNRQG